MTAPTYDATMKTARMTATRDTVADGTLEIRAANSAVLLSFDLTEAGGSVSGAVWTLGFVDSTKPGLAAAGAGTNADHGVIKDTGGTIRISGLSVGTSGTAIIIDSLSVAEGQNVTVSSAKVTHAGDPS